VPIRAITRFLLKFGWKHGLTEPVLAAPKGRSIAVVGSGICGLIAADALTRQGYAVTVFDSRQKPGGRMMNGLPGFRVDKEMVSRRVLLLQRRGIQFRMGVTYGQEVKLSDLRRQFDAIFLSFGHAEPVVPKGPGADLRGVCQALPFLLQGSENGCDTPGADQPVPEVQGKRVVVLGAGDTALDVVRTAIRRGAADVLCLSRRDEASLLADAEEYANAREEGARFLFRTQASGVLGNAAGEATSLQCVQTELAVVAGAARPAVLPVAGSEFEIPVDVVIVAFGFKAPQLPQSDDFAKLETDARGHLKVNAAHLTNLPGVFAGGAILRGTAAMVELVLDARKAADAIDNYLSALPAAK
jgi:glutamate synthase (NADPH/NADH) small chain